MSIYASVDLTTGTQGRRARKRKETADHIAHIAFRLFEQRGFDSVTMEQIAAEADVARATLYNHYEVKEALLDHYFKMELGEQGEGLLGQVLQIQGTRPKLEALFRAFALWCQAKRKYLPSALQYGLRIRAACAGETSELQRMFEIILRSSVEDRGASVNDLPFLSTSLEMLYFGSVVRWLSSGEPSPDREFRQMLDLFFNGAPHAERGSSK